jgi:hypothetical protein
VTAQQIPDVAGRGWHYLIHLTNGEVVKCPGNQEVAERHLRRLREQHDAKHVQRFGRHADTVPYLIGVYPPNAIGGPGTTVRAYGFAPTLYGDIWTEPEDWVTSA